MRQAQLQAAYRNQREKIERLELFINRFRYQATRAKQVQSRIKELEKIKRIELPARERTIRFEFPQPPRSGRMVAEFRGVAKSYEGKQVFHGMSFRHQPRGPHRPGGSEWSGEIHADQDTGWKRAGDGR